MERLFQFQPAGSPSTRAQGNMRYALSAQLQRQSPLRLSLGQVFIGLAGTAMSQWHDIQSGRQPGFVG
jgi:hypothetical protein